MDKRRFENLTRRAVDELVEDLKKKMPAEMVDDSMNKVAVLVEDWATRAQLGDSRLGENELLLGLYVGISMPDRYMYGDNFAEPSIVWLFQRAIESVCANDDEIQAEIRVTVRHEVGHHFGIMDEDALHRMGLG